MTYLHEHIDRGPPMPALVAPVREAPARARNAGPPTRENAPNDGAGESRGAAHARPTAPAPPAAPARAPRGDPAEEFRRALEAFGLSPGASPAASAGRIVRCPTADDKPGRKSGWFVLFLDHPPAGAFGSWKSGESRAWRPAGEAPLSPAERRAESLALRQKMAKIRELREAEGLCLAAKAAERARGQWDRALPAESHPYLEKKGVPALGLRLRDNCLLLPLRDLEGKIHGLQSIDPDGEKRFTFGCGKKGRFFLLPGRAGAGFGAGGGAVPAPGFWAGNGAAPVTALCEGYATAASIHQATGWTVLVCFDAGNLAAVAEIWRRAHPWDRPIICGDDDAQTPGNPGRSAAQKAAEACAGVALLPDFSRLPEGRERGRATDWNDLQALAGLGEVRRQLLREREYRVRLSDWLVGPGLLEEPPPAREWLVEGTFSMASVNLLAAMGGAGKSLMALDLALKVAGPAGGDRDCFAGIHAPGDDFRPERGSGGAFQTADGDDGFDPADGDDGGFGPFRAKAFPGAFGNRVLRHGPVAMFTAEDNRDDVHRRLWSLGRKPAHPFALVPLPSAGGPLPLVLPGGKDGPQPSPWWHEIRSQLVRMRPALIIFDPLASFALVDLNKPEVADFAMSLFAGLADETGACVLVTHHLSKSKENISTPEQARVLVRGSTAIVDRTRAAYVLWSPGESKGKELCAALGEPWARERVYCGCVAKENSGGDKSIKTYVRNSSGLLVARDLPALYEPGRRPSRSARNLPETHTARNLPETREAGNPPALREPRRDRATDYGPGRRLGRAERGPGLEQALARSVAEAAEALRPFSKTGNNGVYVRRNELPDELACLGRNSLERLVDLLLGEGSLVLCFPAEGGNRKWLDIPRSVAKADVRTFPAVPEQPGTNTGNNREHEPGRTGNHCGATNFHSRTKNGNGNDESLGREQIPSSRQHTP